MVDRRDLRGLCVVRSLRGCKSFARAEPSRQLGVSDSNGQQKSVLVLDTSSYSRFGFGFEASFSLRPLAFGPGVRTSEGLNLLAHADALG